MLFHSFCRLSRSTLSSDRSFIIEGQSQSKLVGGLGTHPHPPHRQRSPALRVVSNSKDPNVFSPVYEIMRNGQEVPNARVVLTERRGSTYEC